MSAAGAAARARSAYREEMPARARAPVSSGARPRLARVVRADDVRLRHARALLLRERETIYSTHVQSN